MQLYVTPEFLIYAGICIYLIGYIVGFLVATFISK